MNSLKKKYENAEATLLILAQEDIIRTSDGEGDTPTVDVGSGNQGGGQTPWDPVGVDLGNDSGITGGAN